MPEKAYFTEEEKGHLQELVTKYKNVIRKQAHGRRVDKHEGPGVAETVRKVQQQALCTSPGRQTAQEAVGQHEAKVEARKSSSLYSSMGFTASRSDLTASDRIPVHRNSQAWFKNCTKAAALSTAHDDISEF
ncbi:hypothetical protein HPB49_015869 [Dermacentor silvarum]|uniref:Uncharacterized protein n=1 Tax=Dermacentor silvarum TaxID=543639 RepID=A0ACB8E0Z8_DERSI|nr:hypothetical protein HPB49_015869 [Dermacentor silvarum]